MPDQEKDQTDREHKPVDIDSILLPKKEAPGTSVDSAERINAGALLAQEQGATLLSPTTEAPATAAAPQKPQERPVVRPLQTYQGDIESLVQKGGVSVVSIAAAEAMRKKTPADTEQEPKQTPGVWKNRLLWVVGVVLVMAALGLVAAALLRQAPPPVTTGAHAAIIFVDDTTAVAVSGARSAVMTALVRAAREVKISLGLVERLFVTDAAGAPYPPADLLLVLAPTIPPELLRTLEPQYLLGIHSFDQNQPFLVLKVDSYTVAYRAMLDWELGMAADLSPLFYEVSTPPSPPMPVLELASTTATSTAATSSEPVVGLPPAVLATNFVDKIVENRNARVIERDGAIVLLWTMLERDTILIATNEATLREVIRRMADAPLQFEPQ